MGADVLGQDHLDAIIAEALQQILSSTDLFLYYRTDYTDSRTI